VDAYGGWRAVARANELARRALGGDRQVVVSRHGDREVRDVEREAVAHDPEVEQPPKVVQSAMAGPEMPVVLQLPRTASSGRNATSDSVGFS
jgi:hypothetical protein